MQTIKVNSYIEVPDKYTGIVEWSDGSPEGVKEWLVNGKLHRLDGPAIEWADGSKAWCVDGKKVSKSKYPEAVRLYKIKMVLEG